MPKPSHPVLSFLDGYTERMTWRDLVVVRDALHDHLNHQIDLRQQTESEQFAARFTTPTEETSA